MKTSTKAASQDETVEYLIKRSGRKGFVPVRRSFVQAGPQAKPVPGPAADLLRRHDERGLDLYLLHRALATADPYDVCLDARVWARALNLATPRDDGAVAISQAWGRLAGVHALVKKERSGRLLKVTSLREDGSGRSYTPPGKSGRRGDVYLRLPIGYWREGWHLKFSHAAKTTLLIASSLPEDFYLPTERARVWYGLSADSLSRGLSELRRHDLLKSRREGKTAPAAPLGFTVVERHTLRSPFVHLQKRRLQLVETGAA